MDQGTLPLAETDAASATIFALASGAGHGAIAVFRLSGPQTAALVGAITRLPPPREARLRTLRDPSSGVTLDRALVLFFPGPASYTGEDCVELHVHGGPAVIAAVSDALLARGARPAEPGEFTRRAFLNGRMDLLEAEAVADLVAAQSEAQRRQALRQLEGELGALYRDWAERLRRVLANAEAAIDFADADVPDQRDDQELAALEGAIAAHLADGGRGERVRDGLVVVVAGPPNVGKSSLVNALAGRDRAIVSAVPGTTRDTLETGLDLGGVLATLVDTAGIRQSEDPIEREGVRRAEAALARADVVLAVMDAAAGEPPALRVKAPLIRVANKVDLAPEPPGTLGVSATTGMGLDRLRRALGALVRDLTERAGPPPLTRARHRMALGEALSALGAARTAPAAELRAEELRRALAAFGRITGAVGVEDILDTIFASFCIGK